MNKVFILPITRCLESDSNLQDIWLIKENSTLSHLIKDINEPTSSGYGRASKKLNDSDVHFSFPSQT